MTKKERDELAADVAAMRALGVTKWRDVEVGDPPMAAQSPRDKVEADPHREARRRHDVMFAASPISPPFIPPPQDDAAAPRGLVQRRARNGAPHGSEGTSR